MSSLLLADDLSEFPYLPSLLSFIICRLFRKKMTCLFPHFTLSCVKLYNWHTVRLFTKSAGESSPDGCNNNVIKTCHIGKQVMWLTNHEVI